MCMHSCCSLSNKLEENLRQSPAFWNGSCAFGQPESAMRQWGDASVAVRVLKEVIHIVIVALNNSNPIIKRHVQIIGPIVLNVPYVDFYRAQYL